MNSNKKIMQELKFNSITWSSYHLQMKIVRGKLYYSVFSPDSIEWIHIYVIMSVSAWIFMRHITVPLMIKWYYQSPCTDRLIYSITQILCTCLLLEILDFWIMHQTKISAIYISLITQCILKLKVEHQSFLVRDISIVCRFKFAFFFVACDEKQHSCDEKQQRDKHIKEKYPYFCMNGTE